MGIGGSASVGLVRAGHGRVCRFGGGARWWGALAVTLAAAAGWCEAAEPPQLGELSVILRGKESWELAPHGQGNIYAPSVLLEDGLWRMWYGGQGSDGHDRILYATSSDGRRWTPHGVVIDCGTANHVNDPTVVRVGDRLWMFYTVAETGEMDEIAAATSVDGVSWELLGVVLAPGEGNAWDSLKVGRPSVVHQGGRFRMWYDGQPTAEARAASAVAAAVPSRSVGYAESTDGLTWERRDEPVMAGAGAVDVVQDGDRWLMLIESREGVFWGASPDGYRWRRRGLLQPIQGVADDVFGYVTPHLVLLPGEPGYLFVGAASRTTWDGNRIGLVRVSVEP